jgi:hypothetical protein
VWYSVKIVKHDIKRVYALTTYPITITMVCFHQSIRLLIFTCRVNTMKSRETCALRRLVKCSEEQIWLFFLLHQYANMHQQLADSSRRRKTVRFNVGWSKQSYILNSQKKNGIGSPSLHVFLLRLSCGSLTVCQCATTSILFTFLFYTMMQLSKHESTGEHICKVYLTSKRRRRRRRCWKKERIHLIAMKWRND